MNLNSSDLAGRPGAPGAWLVDPLDPQALVAQLGSEVAAALSGAAARVASLAATGRIDRTSLRALRDEIESARRAAIMGQQLSRLASSRRPAARERLDLQALLHEAVRRRARDIEIRGIDLRLQLAPARVRSDAAVLSTLLQAGLGWCFEHACTRIDVGLTVPGWPARAQLRCGFGYRPADEVATLAATPEGGPDAVLDTMSWRLLQQAATALGLDVWRRDGRGRTELTLDFRDTLSPGLDLLEPGAAEGADTSSLPVQPLAGRPVLTLATRREVCSLVRQALRPFGVAVEFVPTVDEARQRCRSEAPQALVYEAALAGPDFEGLRAELLANAPGLGFVRIVDEGRAFDLLQAGGRTLASIGLGALIETLPAALRFEQARAG